VHLRLWIAGARQGLEQPHRGRVVLAQHGRRGVLQRVGACDDREQ
jgi:hypothetical protein